MEAMVSELQPYVKHGAEFQIDPEAFKRYDVGTVPTYVITTETPGCSADVCAFKSTSRAGDVSLDYALQHMLKSEKDNELAAIERKHLAAMSKGGLP
jgi:type-F conjugative transfer system pilin assembly protein TrbC